jgi:hypothetical protein
MTPAGTLVLLNPEPTFEAIESAGGRVTKHAEAHVLAGFFFVSGEIERVTSYEAGFVGHHTVRDGHAVPDPLILDERFLAARVAGRGVCSRRAPRIEPTVHDLANRIKPRVVAPGHCIGWRAKAALAHAFAPGTYGPSVVPPYTCENQDTNHGGGGQDETPTRSQNFQVIKVDAASGKDLWTALYAEATYDQFIDVAVDGSGNIFVSGHVESQPEQFPVFSHGILLRYTPDGALSWSVVDNRMSRLLAVDASGSAYAAAAWRTTGYNATCQPIWAAVYDSGPGLFSQGFKDLLITPAGDLILAGTGG